MLIATTIAAWLQRKRAPAVFWVSLSCLLLTIVNGGLGALVVREELEPALVSAHLLLALVIVSLLTYVLFRVAAGAAVPLLPHGGWGKLRKILGAIWLLLIVQFLLGAGLREALEHLLDPYPLMSGLERLHAVGKIWPIHAGFGLAMMGALFYAAQTASSTAGVSQTFRRGVWAVVALAGIQVVAGFSFSRIGLQPLVQLFHLWTGSMIVIGVFFLYLCAALTNPDPVMKSALRGPAIGGFLAANLFVGALAAAVVASADASRHLPALHRVPDFAFTDHEGRSVTRADMVGRFHVIDLVFTNCPELCPRMSVNMKALYDRYAGDDSVHFWSVTVDPERDTQAVLAAYAEAKGVVDERWRFMRTDLAAVKSFAQEGLLLGSDGFPEAHSVKFVLVDPNGEIRGYYNGLLARDAKRLERDLQSLAQTR